MIKNNNKKIVKQLSDRSIKANRSRSIMTMLSITLTCILLTSALTISASILKSAEYTTAQQVGTLSHVIFKQIEPSYVEKIVSHNSIKSYSLSTILGVIEDEKFAKQPTEIRTMDEAYMASGFMLPIHGSKPVMYDEIIVDQLWLAKFGLPYELGQKLDVKMRIGENIVTEKFRLVGISQGNVQLATSFMVVSENFKDHYTSDVIGPNYLGAVYIGIEFEDKYSLEAKAYEIIVDTGLNPLEIKVGFNWAYIRDIASIDPKDVIGFCGLFAMIVASGYLIIYNIYLIAITKDIKYYGLLKTIGATEKQIKQIVYKQGFKLYMWSLPFGLSMGYLFGLVLVPFIISTLNMNVILSSTNILIFIFSSLMTLITVYVSCNKPAKLASKVSPLEAIRFTEVTHVGKTRKRKKGNRIHHMAWSNLFRSKKRAVLVILSIALSLSIFSGVLIQISSFDIREHLSGLIGSDYLIAEANYFNNTYGDEEGLPKEIVANIEAEVHPFYRIEKKWTLSPKHQKELLNMIETPDPNSLGESQLREGFMVIEMYSTDEFILKRLSDYVVEGGIPDALGPDEIIVESEYYTSVGISKIKVGLGDLINVEGRQYKIIAIVENLPLYLYDQSFLENSIQSFVSESNGPMMSIMVNGTVDKEKLEKTYPKLVIKSRDDYIDDLQGYILMIKVVGFSFAALLGLIGALNFINLMNTSILVRKKEFAILQSIGMTGRQLKKMLILEGGYIVLLSTLLSFVVSIAFSILETDNLFLDVIYPMTALVVVFTTIMIIIPLITYREMTKISLVARLNNGE